MRTTVTCGSVADLANTLKGGAEYIADVLDSLAQELNKLSSQWLGDASTAYAQAQTDWISTMVRLAAKLNMCAAVGQSAQVAYQALETHIGQAFA
jgi:WXG100 family type VII secretion target